MLLTIGSYVGHHLGRLGILTIVSLVIAGLATIFFFEGDPESTPDPEFDRREGREAGICFVILFVIVFFVGIVLTTA